MTYCPSCGKELPVQSMKFCPFCGGSTIAPDVPHPVVSQPPVKRSHIIRNILVGVIVIVIVVIGVAAAGHVLSPQAGTTLQPSSQPTTAAAATTAVTQYDVVITYSEKFSNAIGYSEPQQGYTFLIITLQIQNNGDRELNTNPLFFHVLINNVKYSASYASYSLLDTLKAVDLQKGGTISGSIAFEIPVGTVDFKPTYEALMLRNS